MSVCVYTERERVEERAREGERERDVTQCERAKLRARVRESVCMDRVRNGSGMSECSTRGYFTHTRDFCTPFTLHTHTHTHTQTHTYTHTHTHSHTYTNTNTHTLARCVHTHMRIVCVCVCVYRHTYIHKYINTYTQT